jgi:hypothetical protein
VTANRSARASTPQGARRAPRRARPPPAMRRVARHAGARQEEGAWAGRCCPIGPLGGN